MASTTTATTSDNVPVHLNREYFKRALESGLRKANLRIQDATVSNLTLGGENYCSNIYGATIKYRCAEDEQDKEKHLIIKSMPTHKQGVLSRLNIFCKETLFYLDIKPKMEALMWRQEREAWNLAARHIYSSSEPEQTILFEDLCKQGFVLKSRQIGLDEMHALKVMQKLGQYHALTMAVKSKEPELIAGSYPFGLLNIESIKAEPFKMLFGAQLLKLAELIERDVELKEIAPKLLKYHNNFTERVLKSVYPIKGAINVLNHGDLWVNNIFFKYESNSLNLKEVRFIDFQLCYYGSPGFDVNYFLNTSVQLDVLKNQRDALIQSYIESLLRTLKELPIAKALPEYDDILQEILDREAYGFFVAFGFFPLMSMSTIDSQDNSLEKLHNEDFARLKIELMFNSNARTMQTLKFTLKRLNDLGILD